jgi:hypothetical protein
MPWRLRLLLPVANVACGAALLTYGDLHHDRGSGISPGSPEAVLCYLINAPAALFRNLVVFIWDRLVVANCSAVNSDVCYSVGRSVEFYFFLVAVGVLWYWVGLQFDSMGEQKRAGMPSRRVLRVIVDVTLVLIGVFFGFSAVAVWQDFVWTRWLFSSLRGLPYAAWATALTVTYGYDLYWHIGRMQQKTRQ